MFSKRKYTDISLHSKLCIYTYLRILNKAQKYLNMIYRRYINTLKLLIIKFIF